MLFPLKAIFSAGRAGMPAHYELVIFRIERSDLDKGVLAFCPSPQIRKPFAVGAVFGIVEELLQNAARQFRAKPTVVDAFFETTLSYGTLAPEHLALASLTAGAVGLILPLARAAIGPAHANLFFVH